MCANNEVYLINEHEAVDLGLPSGLKWASCNIGANSPEEFGNYYAWGETSVKDHYDITNHFLYDDKCNCLALTLMGKYYRTGYSRKRYKCGNITTSLIYYTIYGSDKYDAARRNWGLDWRLPSPSEFDELISCCKWIWLNNNEVNGYKVIGPNGNWIFLPAAGIHHSSHNESGHYWTGSSKFI